MGQKQTKIELLEQRAEEAEARVQENQDQRNALGRQWKDLRDQLRDPKVPAAQRAGIREQMLDLERQIDRLREAARPLSHTARQARAAYNAAQRRLEGARHVIDTVENPPPWGLDCSPAQKRSYLRKARQTIAELTRR